MLSKFLRLLKRSSSTLDDTTESAHLLDSDATMPSKIISPIPASHIQGELQRWTEESGVSLQSVRALWWTNAARDPSPKSTVDWDNGWTGLYFHGGGYLFGTALDRKNGFSRISGGLVQRGICTRVLSVEYTLANTIPERPTSFPLQLLEAVSAYFHLVSILHIPPRRILLIGDSAGGHLVLSLARYLLETECLDPPGGLVLFSPWCDMRGRADENVVQFLGTLPLSLRDTPYLSPAAHAPPPNWPPTFLSSADNESLAAQIAELHDQLVQAGVSVEWCKSEGIPEKLGHDFLIRKMVEMGWQAQVMEVWAVLGEWAAKLESMARPSA